MFLFQDLVKGYHPPKSAALAFMILEAHMQPGFFKNVATVFIVVYDRVYALVILVAQISYYY